MQIKVQQYMATRGSYVHNSMVKFYPENISFVQFSQSVDGLRQNDSQGFSNSYNSINKAH